MRSSERVYTVIEHGGFTRDIEIPGYDALPTKAFDALEDFILANLSERTEPTEFLTISSRRGVGKVITARNYVGVVTLKDGTVIEILPKIAGAGITNDETRRIFLEMLRTLNDVAFKDSDFSQLDISRLDLLEIFIGMFLDEVTTLTKQGLRAAYSPVESNERFYRGKLVASQNLRYNLANKARFYIRCDDFNLNRPENRLLKSTLDLLIHRTIDRRNHQSAFRLLSYFNAVDYSTNYEADFSKCVAHRGLSHYAKALSWCRVFLSKSSFTAFAGRELAFALLFPMERVFESYVAEKLRKRSDGQVIVNVQDNRYCLFDQPQEAFRLRPDIVLEFEGRTIVIDTKWKLLRDDDHYGGISQADMYQMYAYSRKYRAEKVVLVYPNSDLISKTDMRYSSHDGVNVDIFLLELSDANESISKLLSRVEIQDS